MDSFKFPDSKSPEPTATHIISSFYSVRSCPRTSAHWMPNWWLSLQRLELNNRLLICAQNADQDRWRPFTKISVAISVRVRPFYTVMVQPFLIFILVLTAEFFKSSVEVDRSFSRVLHGCGGHKLIQIGIAVRHIVFTCWIATLVMAIARAGEVGRVHNIVIFWFVEGRLNSNAYSNV